jgi:ABC-type multidrug transport system permease subunit
MFAFFLVLTVSWLFVAERRQGTLKRLRAAPLSKAQIMLGKLLPCFALSVTQGLLLLGAGKLIFDMKWGPAPLWLLPVVACTSLAAMGMALFVASLARTETQVSIYGTILVVLLGLLSGCIVPRALMPERLREVSLITPHAWALDAYNQLLLNTSTQGPNYGLVATSCAVLAGFGVGFLGLAWGFLKVE